MALAKVAEARPLRAIPAGVTPPSGRFLEGEGENLPLEGFRDPFAACLPKGMMEGTRCCPW